MDTNLVPVPTAPLNVTLNPIVDFSFDNTSGQFFRKVPSCFYDLSTGELGVLRASKDSYAVFVLDGKANTVQIKIRPLASLGMPIPAYASRTPIDKLKPGDLVSVTGYGSDTWFYYLDHREEGKNAQVQGENGKPALVQVQNPSVRGIRVEDGAMVEITLSESINFTGYSVMCVKNVIDKGSEYIKKMFTKLALLGVGGRGEEGRDKLSKLILCKLTEQGDDKSSTGLDMKSILLLNGEGDNLLMTSLLLQDSVLSD